MSFTGLSIHLTLTSPRRTKNCCNGLAFRQTQNTINGGCKMTAAQVADKLLSAEHARWTGYGARQYSERVQRSHAERS
jgi:hypothetical protein